MASAHSKANSATHAAIHGDFTGKRARTILIVAIFQELMCAATADGRANSIWKPAEAFFM